MAGGLGGRPVPGGGGPSVGPAPVSYTHLRDHETPEQLVCRLLLDKKNINENLYNTGIQTKTTIKISEQKQSRVCNRRNLQSISA